MSVAGTYEKERSIAELAVQRAIIATQHVRNTLLDKGQRSKTDSSPVSLADFAAQALIISALHAAFPGDRFIGEESADELRQDEELRQGVWELVSSARLEDSDAETQLASPGTVEEMLDIIDVGYGPDDSSTGRVWAVDPVDGTRTFLSGGQYTVVAALVVDGVQQVGVIGCPYLSIDPKFPPLDNTQLDPHTPGYIASAVKGHGAQLRALTRGKLSLSTIAVQPLAPSDAHKGFTVGENVFSEKTTIPNSISHKIISSLGGTPPAVPLYSTQLRYVACALGVVDAMWRLPSKKDHFACIWDNAGGALIYQEVGGVVTDIEGKSLVFGTGRKMVKNVCTLGARPDLHARFLAASQREIGKDAEFSFVLKE